MRRYYSIVYFAVVNFAIGRPKFANVSQMVVPHGVAGTLWLQYPARRYRYALSVLTVTNTQQRNSGIVSNKTGSILIM